MRGNSAGEGNDPRVLSRLFAPAITRGKSDKTSGFTKNAGFVAKKFRIHLTNGSHLVYSMQLFQERGTEDMLGRTGGRNSANRYYSYYYFYFYLYSSEVKAICDAHEQVPA